MQGVSPSYVCNFNEDGPGLSKEIISTPHLSLQKLQRPFRFVFTNLLETSILIMQQYSKCFTYLNKNTRHAPSNFTKFTRHTPPTFTKFLDTLHLPSQSFSTRYTYLHKIISTRYTYMYKMHMDPTFLCLQIF